jgi:hypothetical protein
MIQTAGMVRQIYKSVKQCDSTQGHQRKNPQKGRFFIGKSKMFPNFSALRRAMVKRWRND